MKPCQRYAELFVLLLIAYSLVTYFIELEFSALADHEFFVWSERSLHRHDPDERGGDRPINPGLSSLVLSLLYWTTDE